MSVKLGGYGSNRENARPSKYFYYSQRSCRLLPRASSRGLKIASRCLSIPRLEAAGGLIYTYKFVLTCANFWPLSQPATLLSSIAVSHKLKSGTELLSFGHEAGDGRGLRTGTQTRPRNFTQPGTSAGFHDIAEF